MTTVDAATADRAAWRPAPCRAARARPAPAVSSCGSSSASATPWSSSSRTRSSCSRSSRRCSARTARRSARSRGSRSRSTSCPGWSPPASCCRASRTSRSRSPSSATTAGSSGCAGTPLPAAAYFLGKIGQVLVTTLVQTALLLAVGGAAVRRRRCRPTPAAWRTFAWVFVLGTAAGALLRGRVLLGAPHRASQRQRRRHPGRAGAAVHLRGVLRVRRRCPSLDAAGGVGVPAEVDGAGHAVGVPAGRGRGAGAVAARGSTGRRPRSCSRGSSWPRGRGPHLPVAARDDG